MCLSYNITVYIIYDMNSFAFNVFFSYIQMVVGKIFDRNQRNNDNGEGP